MIEDSLNGAPIPKAGEIKTAWQLIGWDDGEIRIVGGRAKYEAVMFNCASNANRVKLARLEPGDRGGIREVKRYVTPETKIEILSSSNNEKGKEE